MWKGFEDSGAHSIFLPKALPVAQIALTGSIYSTLAITVERYLIVCHPFYTVSHKWSAKRYIIPIVAWSLLYNAPKFFELHTTFNETMINITKKGYDVDAAEFRLNEYYIKIYCIWMNFIFMGLIPFFTLILLNAQTLRSLVLRVSIFRYFLIWYHATFWVTMFSWAWYVFWYFVKRKVMKAIPAIVLKLYK